MPMKYNLSAVTFQAHNVCECMLPASGSDPPICHYEVYPALKSL